MGISLLPQELFQSYLQLPQNNNETRLKKIKPCKKENIGEIGIKSRILK